MNFLLYNIEFWMFLICSSGLTRLPQVEGQAISDQGSVRGRRETADGSVSYFLYQQADYARDCKEVFEHFKGNCLDGVYPIKPDGYCEPFPVYCNNSVDGGNWTVFQRRMDGSVNFDRVWNDYKEGFGFLNREFWLGNEKLAYITNQKDYELRIDFVSKSNESFFAKYNLFRVSDEDSKYKMVALGNFDTSSNVVDNLSSHQGMPFTTTDRDNDRRPTANCASHYHNGWWLNSCYHSMPNYPWSSGPYWESFTGGDHNIQYVEMKIRPL